MDKDRHTVERKIYFTPGQWKEIERRAKLLNKRPNVYIRDMAVHGEIKHYDFEKYQELIYPLRGIGVNINQIAMVANSTGEVYKKDIEGHQGVFTAAEGHVRRSFFGAEVRADRMR